MTKHELLQALAPFDDDTRLVVRFNVESGEPFEMALQSVEYMPMKGDDAAYVAIRPYQGAAP